MGENYKHHFYRPESHGMVVLQGTGYTQVSTGWGPCRCKDHGHYVELCALCRGEENVQEGQPDYGYGSFEKAYEQEVRFPDCSDPAGSCDLKEVRETCQVTANYCRDRHAEWGKRVGFSDGEFRSGCHYRHPFRPKIERGGLRKIRIQAHQRTFEEALGEVRGWKPYRASNMPLNEIYASMFPWSWTGIHNDWLHYYDLVSPGGYILMHDYGQFPGVTKFVDEDIALPIIDRGGSIVVFQKEEKVLIAQ